MMSLREHLPLAGRMEEARREACGNVRLQAAIGSDHVLSLTASVDDSMQLFMPTRNVACCTAGVGSAFWTHLIRSSALNPGTHTFCGVVCCVGRDLLKSMFLITESPIRSIVVVW